MVWKCWCSVSTISWSLAQFLRTFRHLCFFVISSLCLLFKRPCLENFKHWWQGDLALHLPTKANCGNSGKNTELCSPYMDCLAPSYAFEKLTRLFFPALAPNILASAYSTDIGNEICQGNTKQKATLIFAYNSQGGKYNLLQSCGCLYFKESLKQKSC